MTALRRVELMERLADDVEDLLKTTREPLLGRDKLLVSRELIENLTLILVELRVQEMRPEVES